MNRIRSNGTARNRTVVARIGTLGAIGLAVFAGTASAAVIIHDNTDGTFQWVVSIGAPAVDPVYGSFLDITQPPTQSGERLPGTFGRWLSWSGSSSSPTTRLIVGEGDSDVARLDSNIEIDWNGKTISVLPIREYFASESISSSANWIYFAPYIYHPPLSSDFGNGTPVISTLAYLGVRRVVDGQVNYGWILLKDYTKPVMWAYETEPNVPIQIPVPSPAITLAGAMFGVSRASQRRRRR